MKTTFTQTFKLSMIRIRTYNFTVFITRNKNNFYNLKAFLSYYILSAFETRELIEFLNFYSPCNKEMK